MKILTIEANDTGLLNRSSLSPSLQKEYDEADIVLGMFTPHSHLILKGPSDLVVRDVRQQWGRRERWIALDGSTDSDETAAENDKLIHKS